MSIPALNLELHTSNHSVEDKPNLDDVSQPSSSCLCHFNTVALYPTVCKINECTVREKQNSMATKYFVNHRIWM